MRVTESHTVRDDDRRESRSSRASAAIGREYLAILTAVFVWFGPRLANVLRDETQRTLLIFEKKSIAQESGE